MSKKPKSYFKLASNWADDYYTVTLASRNRYRIAFVCTMILSIMLSIAIFSLIPVEHFEPLLIHEYQDGAITVEPVSMKAATQNKAMLEAELVRYIQAREAYDPVSYQTQYKLVELMSNQVVSKQYRAEQSKDNPDAVINTLENKIIRKVVIESVLFHQNYAQVNFRITNINKHSGIKKSIPLVATIAWQYRGIPTNPNQRWQNWDGFTVTDYQVSQRNI